MANTKREQHARSSLPGRMNGARARDAKRRRKHRLADAKWRRDARAEARIAEVPELALEPYVLYRHEVAKRRAQGKPTLRTMDELRMLIGEHE